MKFKLSLLLLAGALSVCAQQPLAQPVYFVTSNPTGSCADGTGLRYNMDTGFLSGCVNGTWGAAGGGSTSGVVYRGVFSGLPSASSYTNAMAIVTDCATYACAAGGGTGIGLLQDTGSSWAALYGEAAHLNLGTGSTNVAAGNRGVTNGDSHDHNGGDGAQIAHSNLSGVGTLTHTQLEQLLTIPVVSSTGSDTFTASLTPALTAYVNGWTRMFRPTGASCSGAASIDINSVGVKSLFAPNGTSNPTCTQNRDHVIVYDSTLASGAGAFRVYLLADPTAGTGCVPGGSANQVLVDDGAGGCDATSVEIDGSGNITTPGTIATGDGSIAGCVEMTEVTPGTNFRKICVPDALTQDLTLKLPDGNPAGSVIKYPSPTSSISQGVYVKAAEVSGTPTTNNCAKWSDDHTVADAGAPCGSGGAVAASGKGFFATFPPGMDNGNYTGFTANQVRLRQVNIPVGFTVTKAHVWVQTAAAGSTMYVGIYNSDCTTLLTSGSAASTSATSALDITMSSYVLGAGNYWLAFGNTSATPTVGAADAGTVGGSIRNRGTTKELSIAANAISGGALPASCGTLSSDGNNRYIGIVLDN